MVKVIIMATKVTNSQIDYNSEFRAGLGLNKIGQTIHFRDISNILIAKRYKR